MANVAVSNAATANVLDAVVAHCDQAALHCLRAFVGWHHGVLHCVLGGAVPAFVGVSAFVKGFGVGELLHPSSGVGLGVHVNGVFN